MLAPPENKSLASLAETNLNTAQWRAVVARLNHNLLLRRKEVISLRELLRSAEASNRSYTVAEKSVWSHEAYLALVTRLRLFVEQSTPACVNIIIGSRGDPELLKFGGARFASHFPQNKEGVYTGHSLADSSAMIQHVEELRGRGAHFFVLPATSFWWFQYYSDFRNHLFAHYRKIADDSETCSIFDLRLQSTPQSAPSQPAPSASPSAKIQEFSLLLQQIQEILDLIVPEDASVAVVSRGNPALLDLGSRKTMHFPVDESGTYVGHPADSAEALTCLERARALGAEYLLFPSPATWWLDYYKDFAAHLQNKCRPVLNRPHICALFLLPK